MSFIRFMPVFGIAGALGASGVLAACATTSVSERGGVARSPAALSSPAPSPDAFVVTASPGPAPLFRGAGSAACDEAGAYLTAISVGRHSGYDRVVFQFAGRLPGHEVSSVRSVLSDPKGDEVPLAGQAYLQVVFRGASAVCEQPARPTYAGPSVLTPFYPELLVVSKAGDFERVLSFGIGLAARGGYRVSTLTRPYRVVIDIDHVQLGRFPGIWDMTSWQQYWDRQYSVNNGHQPWLLSPAMVVEAWARNNWNTAPVIHQVGPNTFRVTEPSGRIDTVTGARPVSVTGPWVITRIVYGRPRLAQGIVATPDLLGVGVDGWP
jgi:hypothetical protein